MSQKWFSKIIFLLIFGVALPLSAVVPKHDTTSLKAAKSELRTFEAAKKMFNDGLYGPAELAFADFVVKYFKSEHRSEGILLQARARFQQTNSVGVIELLQKELPNAGALADQYQYWIAESHFQKKDFMLAAQAYADLIKNYPSSSRGLEASYNEALAFSRAGNWKKTSELLGSPDGYFQKQSLTQPENEFSSQGSLLLGEALLMEKKFPEAETALNKLNARTLHPESKWRQQFLLGRAQMAGGNLEPALQTITNALVAASATAQKSLSAQTIFLQGEILQKLDRLSESAQVHEKILDKNFTGISAGLRRQALFKVIELSLAGGKNTEAGKRLENFIEQNPTDPSLDLALVTLGELQLKEYFSPRTAKGTNENYLALTNGLKTALTNFSRVIAEYPQSPLVGKAWLWRGWCAWTEDNMEEAKIAFSEAAAKTPFSEDLAIARFKLADAQFKTGDFSSATTNYNWVVQNCTGLERVKAELLEPALYQVVRAGLAQTNSAVAESALSTILKSFPQSDLGGRSLLLVGQNLNHEGRPVEARALFSDFVKKVPASPLVPELELAVAQTYIQEKNWPMALDKYDQWLANFTNATLLPRVEFSRASTMSRAGMETNAFQLFTNFVTRFPSNSLAPWAQNWVADYYWNREEFVEAQKNYQRIFENYQPPLEFACEARMMAGKAAYARQGFKEARDHFSILASDTNTPPEILAQTYFALGDTIFAQFIESTNKSVEDFSEAITAFLKVTTDFSTNALAPLAWGRIGDCQVQFATIKSDPKAFEAATNAYAKVLSSTLADRSSQNKAAFRLGTILESSQPDVALNYYTSVIYDEENDPQWQKEAGLAAAKLCESQGQWTQAVRIYDRLLSNLPGLKPVLEKKILAARTQLELQKN